MPVKKCVIHPFVHSYRDLDDEEEEPYMNRETLFFLFAVLQALGFVCIILVCIWTDKYLGGFAWDGSSKMFNWHPLLMVMGFVYFYGNGESMYTLFFKTPITFAEKVA